LSLLLDTHIWIWSLIEQTKISPHTARFLAEDRSQLWLSPVSIWELLFLIEKGRLTTVDPVDKWLGRVEGETNHKEAPLTNAVMWELRKFNLGYPDPADRFLVATARVYDLTLVTADERLIQAKACKVLANR